MSASEILEKPKILEILPNPGIKQSENHRIDQENPPISEKKIEMNLKIGQYILTPIESFLLNKIMPKGFKFETEENVNKSIDSMNNQSKKYKSTSKYGDPRQAKLNVKNLCESFDEKYSKDSNHNNKSVKKHGSQKNSNNHTNDHKLKKNKIILKCIQGLEKIKSDPNASFFYTQSQPGEQSLATIEKKINNNEYSTLYDFSMDLRKLWAYNFSKNAKNPEIYQKILKMSELSEQIISDLERNQGEKSNNNSNQKGNEKLKKENGEYKERAGIKENIPAPVKKINNQNYDNKMSIEEKNQLGNSIRSLNKEQLKGIIQILTDPNDNNLQKSKYFEFDIDKLSTKKLRELDKYVKSCINGVNNNVNSTVSKLDKPKNSENSTITKNLEKNQKNGNDENKSESKVQDENNNNKGSVIGGGANKQNEQISNNKKEGENYTSHSDDSLSSDSSLSS